MRLCVGNCGCRRCLPHEFNTHTVSHFLAFNSFRNCHSLLDMNLAWKFIDQLSYWWLLFQTPSTEHTFPSLHIYWRAGRGWEDLSKGRNRRILQRFRYVRLWWCQIYLLFSNSGDFLYWQVLQLICLAPTLLKVVPAIAISYVVYERSKVALGIR